ncbi:stage III sporulation protein AF [Clostridium aestuarii]|uniref:Stage III sporulation protein AF n=1 Tax=Clostridium aestuarii TaxID=338193 RepID=A0ABT4CXM8_9CLOT|nr:stage III sporulation protein AF [Clostridium aestuarii]MCY6483754.1 stage III sporulation protein AF [Clostridium aestuarii]
MIENLRSWIINICSTVIFITAVEMILPNNNMKKYAKFVLGLILVTVLINPVIKAFDKNFSVDRCVNEASRYFEEKEYEKNYDKYKNVTIDKTVDAFSKNLENLCTRKLKEKFPKDSYKVAIDVNYEDEKENFVIDTVKIGVTEGGIKKITKIQKIKIKDSEEVSGKESIDSKKLESIKKYLSDIMDVSKDKITVYKA